MERDEGAFNPTLFKPLEESWSEVQSGRRRGHGAGLASEDGLITRIVARASAALANVRGERHPAVVLQQVQRVTGRIRPRQPMTLARSAHQLKLQRTRLKNKSLPRYEPTARLAQEFTETFRKLTQEKRFPFAAGSRPTADEARRQDSRIIEAQQVAGV